MSNGNLFAPLAGLREAVARPHRCLEERLFEKHPKEKAGGHLKTATMSGPAASLRVPSLLTRP